MITTFIHCMVISLSICSCVCASDQSPFNLEQLFVGLRNLNDTKITEKSALILMLNEIMQQAQSEIEDLAQQLQAHIAIDKMLSDAQQTAKDTAAPDKPAAS